jgi:hypothetical protein
MKPLLHWKSGNLHILSACVLALVIQHAMRMRHIVFCGLSDSTIFFLIIS